MAGPPGAILSQVQGGNLAWQWHQAMVPHQRMRAWRPGGLAVILWLLATFAEAVDDMELKQTQFLSWNPLSIVSEGRAQDFSKDTGNIDFIALQGTGRKCFVDELTYYHHADHTEYSAGWGSSPLTTRSCGCSILIRKKFGTRCIR